MEHKAWMTYGNKNRVSAAHWGWVIVHFFIKINFSDIFNMNTARFQGRYMETYSQIYNYCTATNEQSASSHGISIIESFQKLLKQT